MGLAYLGVFKAMEERNIVSSLEEICGVSIGSLFALFVCLGYTSEQVIKIALTIQIDVLLEPKNFNFFDVFDNLGYDSGINIDKFFKIVIKKKLGNENATFRDLHNYNPSKKLVIGGSNITKNCYERYSIDTTPDMQLWKAVRISSNLPIVYHPFKNDEGDLMCDGGLFNNYPINYYNNRLPYSIGFILNYKKDDNNKFLLEKKSKPKTNYDFFKYLADIFYLKSYSFQYHLMEEYKENTIFLNVQHSFIDLDFSTKVRETLINDGYTQFLSQYDNLINNLKIKYNHIYNSNNLEKSTEINLNSNQIEQESNRNKDTDDNEINNMIDDIQSIISNPKEDN